MTPAVATVSADWLRQQQRRDSRVEYHGPAIQWPIQKLANDTPQERTQ